MRQFPYFLKFAMLSVSTLAMTACSGTHSGGTTSKVSISFPEAEIRSMGSSSGYDFSKACFAVNITASDLPAAKKSCSIPIGVFAGFVAASGTLSVDVPHGTGRSLEVFVYQRATATGACPSQNDFGTMAPNKIVRVGTASFDTLTDVANVNIQLVNPAASDNLVTQYKLASSCSVNPAPPSSAGFTNGHIVSTGGKYVMSGTVSGQRNSGTLAGGNYKIQLTRKPNN